MSKFNAIKILEIAVLIISIGLIVWAAPEMVERFGWEFGKLSANDAPASYIVQGRDLRVVSTNVIREGGVITHTLPASNAVGARLTRKQIKALLNSSEVTRIYKSLPEMSIKVARAGNVSGRS